MSFKTVERRVGFAEIFELLGSMRFAISLLVFICIASVIGTVLPQNELPNTYINQFGLFWVALFDVFAVWNVYNSWWFLTTMGFLVVSTTLCVIRNAPKMVREMTNFREYVRGSSLRAFPNRFEIQTAEAPSYYVQPVTQWLKKRGYAYRVREDEHDSYLIAAKKGGANRLGYIFGHLAIVVICVGGLLDSELPVRMQVWLGDKGPVTENMFMSEVPDYGRLSIANPSYRANMLLPEGARTANAIISYKEGVLLQPIPFVVELEEFTIDYYSTGMPSSYRSWVKVTDPDTKESFKQLVEVNKPLRYKGVTIYQSGFDDGGSTLKLAMYPLLGGDYQPRTINAQVGDQQTVELDFLSEQPKVALRPTELRVINVEDLSSGVPQPKAWVDHVAEVTGSAASKRDSNLVNVGPSVHYNIIDQDGQSFEYVNYMAPIVLDDFPVFLLGMRRTEADPIRYVRIPADGKNSMDEFMRLRAAIEDPNMVAKAAKRFARNHGASGQAAIIEEAAHNALLRFADQGLAGLLDHVPEEERERIASFTIPMLQLTLLELRDLLRQQYNEPAVDYTGERGEKEQEWVRLGVLAIANLASYPAPAVFTLQSFDHVQASVFQVTRSPGMFIVYLGCLFLIIGVFVMIYVRDRRVWVWIRPDSSGSLMTAAMTSQRRNLDFRQEFERFQNDFQRFET